MGKVGTRIKILRIAKGLSQTALARKLGRDSSTVSSWESSDILPTVGIIPKLARVLDVEPMELAEWWMSDNLMRGGKKSKEDKQHDRTTNALEITDPATIVPATTKPTTAKVPEVQFLKGESSGENIFPCRRRTEG